MEHIEIVLVSSECVNKLATIGETGDPMATLSVCLYKSRKLKTVECKHRSNALIMSERSGGQRCLSSVSESKMLYPISKALLTVTLVNDEQPSKLAIISSSSMRILLTMFLKSFEFFIPYLITLSYGLRIVARYLEKL
ncbi:unnamed protein product [Schistosoma mattheei]|uniref:Uncharacterized protein n=1 Tax=Schistosoma mattheei TaxID=31246 RepID=A0A183NSJ4_9TREM|nr:unnamed protein product [Schistosoma mattheei]